LSNAGVFVLEWDMAQNYRAIGLYAVQLPSPPLASQSNE